MSTEVSRVEHLGASCLNLKCIGIKRRVVHRNRHDSEWPEREWFARGEELHLFQFLHLQSLLGNGIFNMLGGSQLYFSCRLAHVNGNRIGHLRDATDMVSMIVGNEQGTLRQVTLCQPFYLQRPRLLRARQLLAIIHEQPPSVLRIFGHASANLIRAAMNCYGQSVLLFYFTQICTFFFRKYDFTFPHVKLFIIKIQCMAVKGGIESINV